MQKEIVFKKNGKEIKAAIGRRIQTLKERLEKRNLGLEELLNNKQRIRSYLLRSTLLNRGHGYGRGSVLYSKEHISSEEVEEINQMCKRIMEIENEIHKLSLVVKHLNDEQEFHLKINDLIDYGFNLDD